MAAAGTSAEQKLKYIFAVDADETQKSFQFDNSLGESEINFVKTEILEAIGIEILERADDFLDIMLQKFGGGFPATFEFSTFARETCSSIESTEDPDIALVEWIDWEHKLFRSLERFIVGGRLNNGFDDVDEPALFRIRLGLQFHEIAFALHRMKSANLKRRSGGGRGSRTPRRVGWDALAFQTSSDHG